MPVTPPTTSSRAALRAVIPGTYVDCASCNQRVSYSAKTRPNQIIANVYCDGKWNRVEHFHEECYYRAESPYGPPAADVRLGVSPTRDREAE